MLLPLLCFGTSIYVVSGSEGGDGSKDKPFGSLQVFFFFCFVLFCFVLFCFVFFFFFFCCCCLNTFSLGCLEYCSKWRHNLSSSRFFFLLQNGFSPSLSLFSFLFFLLFSLLFSSGNYPAQKGNSGFVMDTRLHDITIQNTDKTTHYEEVIIDYHESDSEVKGKRGKRGKEGEKGEKRGKKGEKGEKRGENKQKGKGN